MKKHLFLKAIPILMMVSLPAKNHAQGIQRYNNSLFAEYGFVQYNNNGSEVLGANSRLLSFGLGYHKELTGFLGLGLKGKYYERAGTNTLNSHTIQFQFRLQRPRISRAFRLRHWNPYLEVGFGYAAEYMNENRRQYTAEYGYASLAAGLDYNFSDHWALGLQGEYRLSMKEAASMPADFRTALNPFNTASARLNFYFGRKRKRPAVPRVYTRPLPLVPATDLLPEGSKKIRPADTGIVLSSSRAGTERPPVGALKIKDTVLVRIIGADAGHVPLQSSPVQAQDAVRDTVLNTNAGRTVEMGTPVIGKDTFTLVQRGSMHLKDSGTLIAKKVVVPLQKKDSLLPVPQMVLGKKDTTQSLDTGVVPKPATKVPISGSTLPLAGPDTIGNRKRDTVFIHKRDTVTLFRTGTTVRLQHDTVSIIKVDTVRNRTIIQEPVPPTVESTQAASRSGNNASVQEPVQAVQAAGSPAEDRAALQQWEIEKEELQKRLAEAEAANKEKADMPSSAKEIAAPPVWVPSGAGKNNSNLIVLPVGTGGGRKGKTDETSKGQGLLVARQDSILKQLSIVQEKLARLQAQQADTMRNADTTLSIDTMSMQPVDTLTRRNAGNRYADSVRQAMDKQIRQLSKENEALQQMIGTVVSSKAEQQESNEAQAAGHDVFFNVNQSDPDTFALRQLLAFSDTLRTSGAYWVLLEGFTDKSGPAAYNLKLSARRVASVKAILVAQGIPKENILEKTFGSRFSSGLTNSNDRKVRISQILRQP